MEGVQRREASIVLYCLMIQKYIEEYGHVMVSMSANVHDRAQHGTKLFI